MAFTVACSSGEKIDNGGNNENGSTNNPEQPEKVAPFKVEVLDITATTARVSVSPESKGEKYYFDLLREEFYNEYNDKYGFQQFIDKTINDLMTANSLSKAEVLQRILSAGDDSYGFTNLNAGCKYYAVAMGIDNNGTINTEIVSQPFSTLNVEASDNSFAITVGSVNYTSVSYTVKPSNNSDSYVLMYWNKPTVDKLGDEAFIEHCIKSRSDIGDFVVVGEQSNKFEECVPGREYYLVAFGYNGGLATTGLTKVPFTTKAGNNPSTCTFKFEVSNIQYDRAYMVVTPSKNYNAFFWSVIEKNYYEQRSAEIGHDATMNEALAQTIDPFAQDFGSIHDALDYITSYGGVNVEGTTYGLQQGTEYIPWAVCIDNNGNAIAPFAMGESFTTKSDSVADCKITVKGSFYEDVDGMAVVVSEATPDKKCAGYYNVIFLGDQSSASRQTLLNNILNMGFKDTPKVEFNKCRWNNTVTAVAVGYDSDGNFGEIAVDVFTPKK